MCLIKVEDLPTVAEIKTWNETQCSIEAIYVDDLFNKYKEDRKLLCKNSKDYNLFEINYNKVKEIYNALHKRMDYFYKQNLLFEDLV